MLWQTLHIPQGITAIVGSGGKTTLMLRLAQQLPGRVIVSTSTRILPPELPLVSGADLSEAEALLRREQCICVAQHTEQGKLKAPAASFEALARLAPYVLVEADGSARLPLKAHLSHEPVIPAASALRILIVGASGLFRPIRQVVHRWERLCALTGAEPDAPATPEAIARVILHERLCNCVLINQVHSNFPAARDLAARLQPLPVFAAELQENFCERL